MRQQYHHRVVDGAVHIWDVNKLVVKSQNMSVVDVALSEIQELDEAFWYSAVDGNLPTCRSIADHAKLIQDTDLKYPVLLCAEKRVIDGMHRICKAYMQGMKMIKAVKIDPLPAPDYIDIDLKDLSYE